MPPGAKSFDPIRGYVFSFCFGVGAWSQDRFVQKNVWRSKKRISFESAQHQIDSSRSCRSSSSKKLVFQIFKPRSYRAWSRAARWDISSLNAALEKLEKKNLSPCNDFALKERHLKKWASRKNPSKRKTEKNKKIIWWFQIFLEFSSLPGEIRSNLTSTFFRWVVQPPTSTDVQVVASFVPFVDSGSCSAGCLQWREHHTTQWWRGPSDPVRWIWTPIPHTAPYRWYVQMSSWEFLERSGEYIFVKCPKLKSEREEKSKNYFWTHMMGWFFCCKVIIFRG